MRNLFAGAHALVVGVGADLPNTVNDAEGVAEILTDQERCMYPPGQVHLLTGPEADRDGILHGLDALAAGADSGSTVFIYFSGHGYRASSQIGAVTYLIPYGYDIERLGATCISGGEFAAKLRAIPAQKLILMLDCCHAGGLGESKSPGVEFAKSPVPQEALLLLSEGSGRVVIASSREDELSFAGRPYSAFTLAILEALAGVGVAKKDGLVRVTDLALHAREVVPGRTRNRQHPILHFEQADNFAIAYYAGGAEAPKALPFTTEPEVEPEPGAWREAATDQRKAGRQIHAGRDIGVAVAGNVHNLASQGGTVVDMSGSHGSSYHAPSDERNSTEPSP